MASSRVNSALSAFEENIKQNNMFNSFNESAGKGMYLTEVAASSSPRRPSIQRRSQWGRTSSMPFLNNSVFEDHPGNRTFDAKRSDNTNAASEKRMSSKPPPLLQETRDNEESAISFCSPVKSRRKLFTKSMSLANVNNTMHQTPKLQPQRSGDNDMKADSSVQPSPSMSLNGSLSNLQPGEVYPHTRFYSPLIARRPALLDIDDEDDDDDGSAATMSLSQSHQTITPNTEKGLSRKDSVSCSSPGASCSDAATMSTISVTSSSTVSGTGNNSSIRLLQLPLKKPSPSSRSTTTANLYNGTNILQDDLSLAKHHAKLMRHLEVRSAIAPPNTRRRSLDELPSQSSLFATPSADSSSVDVDMSSPTKIRHLSRSEILELNIDPERKPLRHPLGRKLSNPDLISSMSKATAVIQRITPFDLTLKRAQIQAKSMQLRRGLDSLIADVNSFNLKSQRKRDARKQAAAKLPDAQNGYTDSQIENIEDRITENMIASFSSLSPGNVKPSLFQVDWASTSNSSLSKSPLTASAPQIVAASKIQSRTRGCLTRRRLLRMRIAAVAIQSAVRRMICERLYRIRLLELELTEKHQRRRHYKVLAQLESIKRKEVFRCRLVEKAKHNADQLEELLERRNKLILHLEQENRKIHDQNMKMEAVNGRLSQMNEQTEKSTNVHNENFQTKWKTIEVLSKQEKRLQVKENRYRKRIDKQMANMAATRARSMRETKIRKKLENGLMVIVGHFESKCDDEELVDRIVAIGDGEYEGDESDDQTAAADCDEEEEEGFLLTWCIDDEASINSDITSVHGKDVLSDDEELYEEHEMEELSSEGEEDDDGDDYTCQSSVWVETHSILM